MNTSVKIGKLKLRNPVMAASGTFGVEYEDLVDITSLGAIVTKTITRKPRRGNPPPRLVETSAGMLNAIGLENPGIERFIKEKLPQVKKFKTPAIVSISADTAKEYVEMARRLDKAGIDAIELNLSCPNIKGHKVTRSQGHQIKNNFCKLISQDPKVTFNIVKNVRRATALTLIAKLSPNVTDIAEIAKAAEDAGSDAVSLVNTFAGMAVDIETRRPRLGNVTGGLSGPAIKPIALRMVWETFNKVKVPIIGIGGIMDYKDALEFIICGATAIQVGTANFINPKTMIEIIKGIKEYMVKNKINDINKLIGALKIAKT